MENSEKLIITIPKRMWKFLIEQIDGEDFCYLCNNHPSHGHDKECPLAKKSD